MQVMSEIDPHVAWGPLGLFGTLVVSFASLDAVEDAQSRFRACYRKSLQANQVRGGLEGV
jgi:hypothetical protein